MPIPSKIFKPKYYCHFDRKVLPNENLISKITDPSYIAKHHFYPFLHFKNIASKYSEDGVKTKERHLHYSAHVDRYIYQYYGWKISSKYEEYLMMQDLSQNVAAYRNLGKSNIHFANEAFTFLRENPNSLVLCFDIEKFFDSLNHSILKKNLKKVLDVATLPNDFYKVHKSITNYSWVDRDKVMESLKLNEKDIRSRIQLCSSEDFRNKIRGEKLIQRNKQEYGIPQGSAISAIFSNLYMIDFDRRVKNFILKEGGFYRRYSDDIILILPCSLEKYDIYKDYLISEIQKIKLRISIDKTEITRFRDGIIVDGKPVQYLGFTYENGIIRVRPKTITNYYKKLYQRIKVIKNVQSAKGDDKAFLRKFYSNYSHLGRRNFISYVKRAETIFKVETLRMDTRRHWNKIFKALK